MALEMKKSFYHLQENIRTSDETISLFSQYKEAIANFTDVSKIETIFSLKIA